MKVEIKHLYKRFGSFEALKDIQLTIDSEKFTTLLGPSGCGKTTLLRCIAGLETPDEGEIYFDDLCVYSKEKKICVSPQNRKLGMVFQEFALWPHMSVEKNVAFSLDARHHGKKYGKLIKETLEAVRLSGMEKRLPSELSGGQQQRVAFARAVVSKPSIVLFDEPLSALDALLREQMRQELTNLVRNMGITAIYVTHDQMEAMAMSDQVVIMNQGKIEQEGSPEDIYENPQTDFVMSFVGKMNWFSQKEACVRPEKVSLVSRRGEDIILQGSVVANSYLGDRYEIFVRGSAMEKEWMIYHDQRVEIGAKVKVYVPRNDIKYLNQEQSMMEKEGIAQ